jgi:hypothetical protein
MCEIGAMNPERDEERSNEQGRDDARHLMRSEEIRGDSKRMKYAMRHLEHAKNLLESHGAKGKREKKRKGEREVARD